MTREEIVSKVNALLSEEFEVEQDAFEPEANVKETLSLDSLSLVDLVAIIQQTYKIKIPVADLLVFLLASGTSPLPDHARGKERNGEIDREGRMGGAGVCPSERAYRQVC